MPEKLSVAIFKWLRQSSIRVSRRYLDQQLQSHPDYPSLVSVTDTLDELGIDNMSLVVDKEKMHELPVPFLAHSPVNGGSFIVISDIQRQIKQSKSFEKEWDGIVVLAEKPDGWMHGENEKALVKEKAVKKYTFLGIAAMVILTIFSLSEILSFQAAALLLTAFAGMAIAVLIVQQELGISNEITEQLCSAGKETDCKAVISSKGAKLAGWFSWSDAGVIYFASFLLLLVVSPDISLLSLFSASAVPFVFFSIYYQWWIVKKWCTLCLLTVAVLIVQFLLSLPSLLQFNSITFSSFVITVARFIFLAVAIAWLLVAKPVLQKNKELEDKNFSLLRFKNNPDIFNALLKQQRKVDTTPFENDLQRGNPDAPVQIMVACNPYCGPCAKAHKVLHELVEKTDIGLTIRFTVVADEREDDRTKIIEHILQHLKSKNNYNYYYTRQLLYDWFTRESLEELAYTYPVKEKSDVSYTLKKHESWARGSNVQFTPTIFINGYELPKQYKTNDLRRMRKNEEKVIREL